MSSKRHKVRTVHIFLNTTPITTLWAHNACREGPPASIGLPLLWGTASKLPRGIRILVVSSDLQARELDNGCSVSAPRLIGEVVAEWLDDMLIGGEIARADEVGVLLPGDYWSYPMSMNKLGGYGDVRPVWDAFADRFGGVVGVPGNHDIFEPKPTRNPVAESWREDVSLLVDRAIDWGGLRIAGVGGCVGNNKRPFRYTLDEHLQRVSAALAMRPDILVLHQGPSGDGRSRPGTREIGELLDSVQHSTLVVCGHDHWGSRLISRGRCKVLNAHQAIILLATPEAASRIEHAADRTQS